jgi:hypothetical protein
MLDYLMGDAGKPEDAFAEDVATKYESIRAVLAVGDREVVVERRWKQPQAQGTIFVDDDPVPADEFSRQLLGWLDIPLVHYPQGNPYSERKWPELSWRSLYRHIYRQQRFWTDIADRQPPSEQQACVLLFLGIAEHVFSSTYGDAVSKRKQLYQLQGGKEQFTRMLEQLSKELIADEDLRVGLTPQSINTAMARLQGEIEAVGVRRVASPSTLLHSSEVRLESGNGHGRAEIDQLGEEWVKVQAEKEHSRERVSRAAEHLAEYRATLQAELARLTGPRSRTVCLRLSR